MSVKIEQEANIKDLGIIKLYTGESYDKKLDAVKSDGAKLISARDLAYARRQAGKNHSLCQNGSYVKEGSLFVPDGKVKRYFLRNSLVLRNPSNAVEQHRKNEEYFLKEDFHVKKFLEKLPKGAYLAVNNTSSIPVTRYGEDERTVWLFGDQAQAYGTFLKDSGVSESNIFMNNDNKYVDAQPKPFANQLWLGGLGDDSNIGGGDGGLNDDGGVRGVLRVAGEARTQKISLPYSNKDVEKQTKLVQEVRAGNLKASELEKTIAFFEKLKQH